MEKRDKQMNVLVSESEMRRIRMKMEEVEITCLNAYIRKMALDGYCVKIDLKDVKEMVSLLRRCSNNLNQYAKRANETGSIYKEDIQDLQNRLDEIWKISKEILARLSSI
ncbi:plasmid mobilization relaxosome protein MobC [Clostridioides difficile]|nr:plasmid mobilization relaxosome protein MobC [Clostridioides difficile]EKG0799246.1 plasmid mobilization relaxosome protein MobC [Clostridioides difficile]EKS6830865.1 plasmid mobilization relaxosome protein MobC [Clostridioides difficile]MBY2252348.1 MobC family plasmid mobilization relaxosome protein [Clostridioides difficile]MCI2384823.1 MobC family plasmid mobilization relaxosome protein [Clostridioides difficile]